MKLHNQAEIRSKQSSKILVFNHQLNIISNNQTDYAHKPTGEGKTELKQANNHENCNLGGRVNLQLIELKPGNDSKPNMIFNSKTEAS